MKQFVRRLYDWFMYPHWLVSVRKFLRSERPRLLDVGCGNHSPRTAKRYLPLCEYHGLDRARWNRDAADDRCMERFFDVDLEDLRALDQVPDGYYDAVICSHVLEHVADPYGVAHRLTAKLKPGGVLYVETPSARSLSLPRAKNGWWLIRGCLNYYDDESHRTFVDLRQLATELQAGGLRVFGPRRRRLWRRIWCLPVYILAVLIVKRFIPASIVWDVAGFADVLVAQAGET